MRDEGDVKGCISGLSNWLIFTEMGILEQMHFPRAGVLMTIS